jgi:transcription-repair coupling factor (superfamily II helicase)
MMPASTPELKTSPTSLNQWLFQRFAASAWFAQVRQALEGLQAQQAKPASLPATLPEALLEGLENPSIKAMLLLALLQQLQRSIVVVCPDAQQLSRLQVALDGLMSSAEQRDTVLRYPADVFSPYDGAVLPIAFLREHAKFLAACQAQEGETEASPKLFLLTARSLVVQFPASNDRLAHGLTLSKEQEVAPEAVIEQCLCMGYSQTGLVMEPGDVSRRGDLIDIYPMAGEPVRLSFFGDTIESLRTMDAENQRSVAAAAPWC